MAGCWSIDDTLGLTDTGKNGAYPVFWKVQRYRSLDFIRPFRSMIKYRKIMAFLSC
jgi:hypothetical protein